MAVKAEKEEFGGSSPSSPVRRKPSQLSDFGSPQDSQISDVLSSLHRRRSQANQISTPAEAEKQADKLLIEVEKSVVGHHAARLKKWADQQRLALQRALELEQAALAAQAEISETSAREIAEMVREQRQARSEARAASAAARQACQREVHDEFFHIGQARAAQADAAVRDAVSRLRAVSEASAQSQWRKLESSLQRILWQHHSALHRAGLHQQGGASRSGAVSTEDLAQVLDSGELRHHLDVEHDGWSRSQRTDLDHLRFEVDAEFEDVFQKLESKLKLLTSSGFFSSQGGGQSGPFEEEPRSNLAALMESTNERMEAIASELRAGYEPKIEGALRRCEEDYRSYDSELHSIQARMLESKIRNASDMRRLKLALCRWRLDYQRLYHACQEDPETMAEATSTFASSGLLSPRSPGWLTSSRVTSADSVCAETRLDQKRQQQQKHLQQRLATARKLVLELWAKRALSTTEIHEFLGRVAEAAARDGTAGPMLRVYHNQLKQNGALPLLEHAHRPELLECWLQELAPPLDSSKKGTSQRGSGR